MTMAGLSFREAGAHDLPDVLALYDAAVDGPGANDPARAEAHWPRLQAAGATVLLADQNGLPVATLVLYSLPLLAHGCAPEALVESVAVHPEAQGRGIGRALLQEAMRRAAQAGCYKLALTSNVSRSRAHAFYDRLGFERHGISFVVAPAKEFA
jgi:ribosomal protein S18 acetylase RimI-like enzyme